MASNVTTTSHELDRKALRRPDEFTQSVRKFFDSIAANSRTTLAVIGVFFLIGLAYAFYSNQKAESSHEASDALYKARHLMETRLAAMAPASAADAKDSAKARDEKGAKPAAKE